MAIDENFFFFFFFLFLLFFFSAPARFHDHSHHFFISKRIGIEEKNGKDGVAITIDN